jgi:hypothetical protein
MEKIELKDHIYGGRVNVIVSSWNEFVDEHEKRWQGNGEKLAKDEGPESEMRGGFHCEMFGLVKGRDPVADSMIWVNEDLEGIQLVVCLTHELLHAALSLMDLIGVDLTEKAGNQELVTYWHGWALTECLIGLPATKKLFKR